MRTGLRFQPRLKRRADAKAFNDLLGALQSYERKFRWRRMLTRDNEFAEGYSSMLDLLAVGLDCYIHNSPDEPHFVSLVSPIRKIGGDNADALYLFAPLNPGRGYRVHGTMGSAVYLAFTVYPLAFFASTTTKPLSSKVGPPSASTGAFTFGTRTCRPTTTYITRVRSASSEVQLREDGSWELWVSHRHPGRPNWISTAGHPRGFVYFPLAQVCGCAGQAQDERQEDLELPRLWVRLLESETMRRGSCAAADDSARGVREQGGGRPHGSQTPRRGPPTHSRRWYSQDLENHQVGVRKAAEKLALGFAVRLTPRSGRNKCGLRLRILQQPKKGIDEFVASPMSFLAAVGSGRRCRGARPRARSDGGSGLWRTLRRRSPGPRRARPPPASESSSRKDPNAPSSWSILFAAPSIRDDRVVGAALAGIPLSRLAQRLSRQFRVEQSGESPVWVYLYKGDRLFHWDTPPEVDALIRDPDPRFQGPREGHRLASPRRRAFRASSRSTASSRSSCSPTTSASSSFGPPSERAQRGLRANRHRGHPARGCAGGR